MATKYHEMMRSHEKQIIQEQLEAVNWNISAAARALGISRPTLYAAMARCQIFCPRVAIPEESLV